MTRARPLALLACTICFGFGALPSLGHNIIASVFPSGTAIEGEIGFSNGAMADGQRVEVFDDTGRRLGETVTDESGFFLFTPTEPVAHVFRADLGAGHVANTRIAASEVARILGVAGSLSQPGAGATIAFGGTPSGTPEDPVDGATIVYVPGPATTGLTTEDRAAIAEIVREETRPIRQEIARYKEKNDMQSVLGGIGYIVGLVGVGYYIAARRKLKGTA